MSKELKIKGNFGKDFQQVYIGDEPTNIFINDQGEIRTSSIKNDRDGSLEINSKSKDISIKSGGDIRIASGNLYVHRNDTAIDEYIKIYVNGDESTIESSGGNDLVLSAGDGEVIEFKEGVHLGLRHDASLNQTKFTRDANNYFEIKVEDNGATTLKTLDGGADVDGKLTIVPDGELELNTATSKTIHSKRAIGFTKISETVGASSTTIDFREGNKAEIRLLVYNNTTLNLKFPSYSGNFTLVLEQYLTGSIAIATWKALDADGNDANNDGGSAGAIRWAGGSAPTLSTSAGSFDIVSFYWDATREMAFGVPSLNFS
tara:strand:+ start:278 stop:1228 length:951 start_codon:yes stop_codon:yes gene_type:complete